MTMYVDREGRPLDLFAYMDYINDPTNFLVQRSAFYDAKTRFDYAVSTIFEGINLGFAPAHYETMVFCADPNLDAFNRRYSDEASAVAGHLKVCRMVTDTLLQPVAVYRQLPWLPAREVPIDD